MSLVRSGSPKFLMDIVPIGMVIPRLFDPDTGLLNIEPYLTNPALNIIGSIADPQDGDLFTGNHTRKTKPSSPTSSVNSSLPLITSGTVPNQTKYPTNNGEKFPLKAILGIILATVLFSSIVSCIILLLNRRRARQSLEKSKHLSGSLSKRFLAFLFVYRSLSVAVLGLQGSGTSTYTPFTLCSHLSREYTAASFVKRIQRIGNSDL